MPETRKKRGVKLERSEPSEPDVIVDFVFDEGLFFISISNISDKPAYRVSVKFDCKIYGSGGKDICALPLFRNIEFLAPHKAITTFLDSSGSYFSSGGPTKVSARISYHDFQGTKKVATINHDLEIYRQIGFIRRPKGDE
ncbi:MAG TPA: hypothetical protein VHE60_12215 [Pyrinomonadaceae bacterium]|nr:hypothetical protein [Pyrinomonadaceae bacterium]